MSASDPQFTPSPETVAEIARLQADRVDAAEQRLKLLACAREEQERIERTEEQLRELLKPAGLPPAATLGLVPIITAAFHAGQAQPYVYRKGEAEG